MRAFRTWALLISLAGHLGLVAWLLHKPPGAGSGERRARRHRGRHGSLRRRARCHCPHGTARSRSRRSGRDRDTGRPGTAGGGRRAASAAAAAVETELPPVIGSTAGEEVAAVEPERAETRTTGPATEAGTVEAEAAEIPSPERQVVATEPEQVRADRRSRRGPCRRAGGGPDPGDAASSDAGGKARGPATAARGGAAATTPAPACSRSRRRPRLPRRPRSRLLRRHPPRHRRARRDWQGIPERPMPAATVARPAAGRRAHRRTM